MASTVLPELLAPAGSMEKLDTALFYGADAVYLGGRDLNLRASTDGFTMEELSIATQKAHAQNAKVFYCLNSFIHDTHVYTLYETLDALSSHDVDAIIAADPGVIALIRKKMPNMEIHLSTQANTVNSLAIAFWHDLGVQRINLARELSIKEIRTARLANTDVQLEVFVHGAMCMAMSGQCLLSKWLNNREANLGACTQPCRFQYSTETLFPLTEKQRLEEGYTWFIEQQENYSAILASEDLCLIQYIPWFIKNAIDSLKIEGRMKSIGYLAYTVDAYRTALLDYQNNTFNADSYLHTLYNQASRPLSTGFFLPQGRKIITPPKIDKKHLVVARVEQPLTDSSYHISVRQPLNTDLPLNALLPRQQHIHISQYSLENASGASLPKGHPGMSYTLRCELETPLPQYILLQQ